MLMKKITIINCIMAFFMILTVWIPYTRIFLLDVKFGNNFVIVLSIAFLLLCLFDKNDKIKG